MAARRIKELEARLDAIKKGSKPLGLPEQVLSTYRIAVRGLKEFRKPEVEIMQAIASTEGDIIQHLRRKGFELHVGNKALFFALLSDEFRNAVEEKVPKYQREAAFNFVLRKALGVHADIPREMYDEADAHHLLKFLENVRLSEKNQWRIKAIKHLEENLLPELKKRK